jgi:hypothetical protein
MLSMLRRNRLPESVFAAARLIARTAWITFGIAWRVAGVPGDLARTGGDFGRFSSAITASSISVLREIRQDKAGRGFARIVTPISSMSIGWWTAL